MRDTHFEALQILVFFVGLLIFAIALPFILKAFRKMKAAEKTLSETTETSEGLRTAEELKRSKANTARFD